MNVYQVIGPPGCGKTTHLARLARDVADQRGGDRVLISSLTKSAAAEIGGRDTGVPDHNVGTLHAFCYHAVGAPEIAESKIKEWNENAPPHLRMTGGKTDLEDSAQTIVISDVGGDERLALCNIFRAQMIPKKDWPKVHTDGGLALEFFNLWQEWCDDNGYVDFTGLIEQAAERSFFPPNGTDVLLFDEAQDYSKLEMKVCRQWGEEAHSVVFVGDPDQSIYSWRGADPGIFLNNPVPEKNRRLLDQSYRVPAAVVGYATDWIRQINDRIDVAYKPTQVEGRIYESSTGWRVPDWGDLTSIIEESEDREETVMVLSTCDYMLRPTLSHLRSMGIPFHNPYRKKNGAWNPIKVGKEDQVTSFDKVMALKNSASASSLDDIAPWIDALPAKIFKRGVKASVKRREIQFSYENVRNMFLDESDFNQAMGGNLDWFLDTVPAAEQSKYTFAVCILDREQRKYEGNLTSEQCIAALSREPSVIVGTCHSVKGGEADNVVIFPDISREAWRNSDDADSWNGVLRTFYVGLTRAKKTVALGSHTRGSPAVDWLPANRSKDAA